MTARQAQLRMVAIEMHEQDWSSEQFLAWLLDLGDHEQTGVVIAEEARRAFILAGNHYQRVTKTVAVLNPQMIATIGFIQGATFAAAALGREPLKGDL
jgi:hypothetical protein